MSEKNEHLREDVEYIKERVDQIYTCLYVGNGKPALMTRVFTLELDNKKHGENWAGLIKTLLQNVLVGLIMYLVMK